MKVTSESQDALDHVMETITVLLGTILEDIKKAVTAKAESTQQTEEARRSFMDK